MRTKLIGLIAGGGLMLSAAAPVLAHHSFAAEFDANQPVKLEGTVKEFRWVNPHSWLIVNVPKPDGTMAAIRHQSRCTGYAAALCTGSENRQWLRASRVWSRSAPSSENAPTDTE